MLNIDPWNSKYQYIIIADWAGYCEETMAFKK